MNIANPGVTAILKLLSSTLDKEFRQTFRSLKYRNIRIFLCGQMLSLSCTWMQMVAMSWLVYRLTKDPIFLGLVEGANLLPMLLFGLAGGSIADRFDRRRVMITTQVLAMFQAMVLAVLTLTGTVTAWHCLILAAFLGTVNAFEVPSRQTLLVNMVAREDLVNAVSLGSSIFNVARSVGPALAGIIVAMQGEGICFVINAVSYSFALIALCMLKLTTDQSGGGENQGEKPDFRDGIDFVIGHETVLRIICLAVAISLFGLQFSVILPIFASEIMGGGVETLGLLRAANGFGALLAALTLASRAQGKLLRTGVGAACVVYGLSLILFSFSTVTWISTLIMLVTGFALVTMLSGGNSLVQLSVPDQLRGRVMSIYMTLLLGLAPAGSVFIGWLAARVGAPTALAINATIVSLAGCVYLLSLFVFKKASATKDGINSL